MLALACRRKEAALWHALERGDEGEGPLPYSPRSPRCVSRQRQGNIASPVQLEKPPLSKKIGRRPCPLVGQEAAGDEAAASVGPVATVAAGLNRPGSSAEGPLLQQ